MGERKLEVNTFIIFSKETEDAINFAEQKLGMKDDRNVDCFIISNNFDETFVENLLSGFTESVITIFITKGINPGDPGVWNANYIIDDKEDIKRWKETFPPCLAT